ncbi:FAD:protein FMN transferase [uncultured Psychroserpens sp.]|uniref:FAD:protein FMN transferase n=1 Tax=uncultured Psychroserpens sp. TaxID=255436 RepID=UPI00262D4F21|nr:FAD:protein FMN transferase [uncultured Psychroserpens sp.]
MKQLSYILILCILFSCKEAPKSNIQEVKNTKISGPVFGTSFSTIYASETDYTKQFDSLFNVINQSMSTYITDSDISRINRNESTLIDDHFKRVLMRSKDIYGKTNGVFDPTIGAVVNAWSFGPKGEVVDLDSLKINELMKSVGLHKVELTSVYNIKKPENTFIDFNAIAKGYGVDVIGEFLESKGIQNYLVEIGGEIRVRGKNMEKGTSWRVGLDEPRFDGGQSVYKAISLTDEAMATSGTYRKFKTDASGNRYAHIINTKTGYPTKTNILSVSVIAKDCMTADAYATAFQAMGIDKVSHFLQSHPELKVFIIFENENKEFETLNLNEFPKS